MRSDEPAQRMAELGESGFIEFTVDEPAKLIRIYALVWVGLRTGRLRSDARGPAVLDGGASVGMVCAGRSVTDDLHSEPFQPRDLVSHRTWGAQVYRFVPVLGSGTLVTPDVRSAPARRLDEGLICGGVLVYAGSED